MVIYKNFIKDVQNSVNLLLPDYILSSYRPSEQIIEAMSYSLMMGGKRIRPALCIGANEAVGNSSNEIIMPIACAIEMVHTYSLIHDDLPSMDNDILRRGSLTCHMRFDDATAILAGDALLTLAFEIITRSGLKNNFLSSEDVLKIIYEISTAAGFKGMIAGQMKDISSEGNFLSKNQLEEMHILKTGMIIKAAVISGGIVGSANNYQLEKLGEYAHNVGLAFQIVDDILNVVGNPSNLGKSVGTDITKNKNTYPSILGLEKSKKIANKLINRALKALDCFGKKANPLRTIAYYVLERNL